MSIVVRFAPSAPVSTEQYDETIRKLEAQGDFPPDGLDYHVAFHAAGNLRASEIWDSQEKFEAFGERLMPILTRLGSKLGSPRSSRPTTRFGASACPGLGSLIRRWRGVRWHRRPVLTGTGRRCCA